MQRQRRISPHTYPHTDQNTHYTHVVDIIIIILISWVICAYDEEYMLVIDDKSIFPVHIIYLDSEEVFKKVSRQKILNQPLVYTDGLLVS